MYALRPDNPMILGMIWNLIHSASRIQSQPSWDRSNIRYRTSTLPVGFILGSPFPHIIDRAQPLHPLEYKSNWSSPQHPHSNSHTYLRHHDTFHPRRFRSPSLCQCCQGTGRPSYRQGTAVHDSMLSTTLKLYSPTAPRLLTGFSITTGSSWLCVPQITGVHSGSNSASDSAHRSYQR